MKKAILLLVSLCLLAACQKEDSRPDCERNNFGARCFENATNAPVDVFVDGNYRFTLPAATERCIPELSAGLHQVRGEQSATGKSWAGSFDVVQCGGETTVFRP